jgi:hypothetical protein
LDTAGEECGDVVKRVNAILLATEPISMHMIILRVPGYRP